MFFLSFKQEFYCVCCGSLKKYKGYFTCSRTCASNYRNRKNTHWRTYGLSCKYCVECGAKHSNPAVNSSPYCSGNCRRTFKDNCRKMGNPEPRDRGNRGNGRNQQGAQLVQQPRQQNNNWNNTGNRRNGRNQQGAQFVVVQQPQQQYNNWNPVNRGNQQGAQFVVVQQPQQQNLNRLQPSVFGKLVGTYNFQYS